MAAGERSSHVYVDPDSAPGAYHSRRPTGHRRKPLPPRRSRSRRRLWLEAERLCRRSAHGFHHHENRQPVKWIESRRENFCHIHGRGHVDYFEIAAKKDAPSWSAPLSSFRDSAPSTSCSLRPSHTQRADDAGLYNFRNIEADVIGVFTNCVPPTRIARRCPEAPTASSAWSTCSPRS